MALLSGCGDGDAERIERQRETWNEKHVASYVVETCDTGFSAGCRRVAVEDGQVVAAREKFPNDDSPWSDIDDLTIVDEPIAWMFDRAEGTPDDCELSQLSFDAQFGFIREYYVSCGEEGSGERVTCFATDTVDLAACE
ncbi:MULTISPECIES: hypothetical protein [Sorangium]|uniref:Lipoprotein n=1 Tax=Sorangium cellulosum TaxID=56 RepID=A0A4P2QWG1_SORCE|nr:MULTISPECIES: hypothetical protein [Sorangium]AUX34827.1 uncharacterized protein SOCE836_070050 [Sorangium cellulosum]WCQ94136.1 hypothetical protein NQZ70_06893 [Sorangium sp. Soce836]